MIVCKIGVEKGKIIDGTGLNKLTFINMPTPTIGVGQGRFGEDCLDKSGSAFINVALKKPITEFTASYWINVRSIKTEWFEPFNFNSTENFMYIYSSKGGVWYQYYGAEVERVAVPLNKWIHVYINIGKDHQIFYFDGVQYETRSSDSPIIRSFQLFGSNSYINCDCKMSNIVIWDKWKDFTGVPTNYIGVVSRLYINENKQTFGVI
nr:MAG TPA: SIALIDASE A [Caudoviricetes sp.]